MTDARFISSDGLEVALDDIVYYKGEKRQVVALTHKGKLAIRQLHTGLSTKLRTDWVKACTVYKKEPDSWETIKADAESNHFQYWNCGHVCCADCPSRINGKIPSAFYETPTCHGAMVIELILRDRKLRKAE